MQLGPQSFTLSRSFRAPADLVFRLWTEPAYVSLWWGVAGSTIPLCELDVRPGGRWRIDMQTASGRVYRNEGEYLDVRRNELLSFSDVPHASIREYEGNLPGIRHHRVTFASEGEVTGVQLEVQFANPADLERHIGFGMPNGLGQSLARLEALIASLDRPRPG